jgi:hypothetical protein
MPASFQFSAAKSIFVSACSLFQPAYSPSAGRLAREQPLRQSTVHAGFVHDAMPPRNPQLGDRDGLIRLPPYLRVKPTAFMLDPLSTFSLMSARRWGCDRTPWWLRVAEETTAGTLAARESNSNSVACKFFLTIAHQLANPPSDNGLIYRGLSGVAAEGNSGNSDASAEAGRQS